MSKIKEQIKDYIRQEDKNNAVISSVEALEKKEISVHELYEEIVKPVLYEIDCKENDVECIWKEHVKSAIVRMIIESSYKFVIEESKKAKKRNKKVLIVCPTEEYHVLGARIAHDYFVMSGFEAVFVGANTPLDVVLNAMTYTRPDYVAISVTNYYNVINAKKIINAIKKIDSSVTILAGGQAFNNEDALKAVQADGSIKTFEDIMGLE